MYFLNFSHDDEIVNILSVCKSTANVVLFPNTGGNGTTLLTQLAAYRHSACPLFCTTRIENFPPPFSRT